MGSARERDHEWLARDPCMRGTTLLSRPDALLVGAAPVGKKTKEMKIHVCADSCFTRFAEKPTTKVPALVWGLVSRGNRSAGQMQTKQSGVQFFYYARRAGKAPAPTHYGVRYAGVWLDCRFDPRGKPFVQRTARKLNHWGDYRRRRLRSRYGRPLCRLLRRRGCRVLSRLA